MRQYVEFLQFCTPSDVLTRIYVHYTTTCSFSHVFPHKFSANKNELTECVICDNRACFFTYFSHARIVKV